MHTDIRITDKELEEINAIAQRLYPGKGLTHLITMELHKHIRIRGGIKACDNTKESKKIRKTFIVPETLVNPLVCVCEEKKISVTTFIMRYILYPHLDKI